MSSQVIWPRKLTLGISIKDSLHLAALASFKSAAPRILTVSKLLVVANGGENFDLLLYGCQESR